MNINSTRERVPRFLSRHLERPRARRFALVALPADGGLDDRLRERVFLGDALEQEEP